MLAYCSDFIFSSLALTLSIRRRASAAHIKMHPGVSPVDHDVCFFRQPRPQSLGGVGWQRGAGIEGVKNGRPSALLTPKIEVVRGVMAHLWVSGMARGSEQACRGSWESNILRMRRTAKGQKHWSLPIDHFRRQGLECNGCGMKASSNGLRSRREEGRI